MATTDKIAENKSENNVQVPKPKISDFQQAILHILTGNPCKGLRIKDRLEGYYEKDINHGRLYPNLDTLNEMGLVEKQRNEPDKRSNRYLITEFGRRWLQDRRKWEEAQWSEADSRHSAPSNGPKYGVGVRIVDCGDVGEIVDVTNDDPNLYEIEFEDGEIVTYPESEIEDGIVDGTIEVEV